ncbi:cytochrome P450 [Paenibacillus sp. BC26]|uniref:cytochrome P450 n=1 Tax=Paenibacillus sp. BC26 TaxID=1881032 RepID=UPI0008E99920|nr:cytochrome P450 [Paenibacillus sp. BC26]SFS61828.1 hypothetical protein/cytochrome P450 PksS [Paenibacillus sp. BC26]
MQNQSRTFEISEIASWFGPYNVQVHDNPYSFYNYLLEQEPVRYLEWHNMWVVSRYEDVNRVLKDPLFVRENRNAMPQHQQEEQPPQSQNTPWEPVNNLLDNWMLLRDAPTHTRLRGLVSHSFTPRSMERLKQNIRSIAEHLAEQMAEEDQPDLIQSFAFPLPVIVIAEMLGVPPEDREMFKEWSHTFARILEGGGDQTPEFAEQSVRAAVEITAYFRSLIAERKVSPREDMISDLLAAKEQTDALTEQELIATCVLLLVAGHETTVNLIGNTMLALLNHPEQYARLLENPTLIPSAVEEGLRYESPVQMTSRLASVDYELGGQTILQGQVVQVMLGAANRDPAQFSHPNQFDIGRTPNRHLAFASGAHFCLGAPLARLEGEIALTAMLKHFPQMRLADAAPNWRHNVLFRGMGTMHVR